MKSSPFEITSGSLSRTDPAFETRSGFSLALIANVLWGTSFLASKYTLQSWGPVTASTLRFAVALIALAIAFRIAGKKICPPRSWPELTSVALVGFTGFGLLYPLQLGGLTEISSGLSSAIMLTSPLFVISLAAPLLGENFSGKKTAAMILGIVGGYLILEGDGLKPDFNASTIGMLLTLGASLSLAWSAIATRKALSHLDSENLTFWSMLFGLVMLSPFAFHETLRDGLAVPSFNSVLALLYLAIVCSAVCFLVWNKAIARSSPRELATTMHVKTPTAVFLGAGLAGESISMPMLIGVATVAIGVWLSQSEKPKEA